MSLCLLTPFQKTKRGDIPSKLCSKNPVKITQGEAETPKILSAPQILPGIPTRQGVAVYNGAGFFLLVSLGRLQSRTFTIKYELKF